VGAACRNVMRSLFPSLQRLSALYGKLAISIPGALSPEIQTPLRESGPPGPIEPSAALTYRASRSQGDGETACRTPQRHSLLHRCAMSTHFPSENEQHPPSANRAVAEH